VLAAATPAAGSKQQEGTPKAAAKPKPSKKTKDPKEKAAKVQALTLKQQVCPRGVCQHQLHAVVTPGAETAQQLPFQQKVARH
jgi:hypothetical protein